MTVLERLKERTGEADSALLTDLLESARAAIIARRFPYGNGTERLETQYEDLQYRIALDLYNKEGAEGELSHSQNGIVRAYESSWISEQLLKEVTPMCGGLK